MYIFKHSNQFIRSRNRRQIVGVHVTFLCIVIKFGTKITACIFTNVQGFHRDAIETYIPCSTVTLFERSAQK